MRKYSILLNCYFCLLRYWDERYASEFERDIENDWLFDYSDLKPILNHLLPDKSADTLIIGCGNAPFSADMCDDEYTAVCNADYSSVVIQQQRERHPHLHWEVMDAFATKLEQASVPAIIDKSGPFDSAICGDDW